jgi:hypothetical protein
VKQPPTPLKKSVVQPIKGLSSSDDILKKVSMAPRARHAASQPALRTVTATAVARPRRAQVHDARNNEVAAAQLDWLQPALDLWLRDEVGSSARIGDVPQAGNR